MRTNKIFEEVVSIGHFAPDYWGVISVIGTNNLP